MPEGDFHFDGRLQKREEPRRRVRPAGRCRRKKAAFPRAADSALVLCQALKLGLSVNKATGWLGSSLRAPSVFRLAAAKRRPQPPGSKGTPKLSCDKALVLDLIDHLTGRRCRVATPLVGVPWALEFGKRADWHWGKAPAIPDDEALGR